MIVAEQISVSLGGHQILRDVNLRVEAGEVLVLLGPNGAGKSTLLSVLSGDLRPDQGQVTFAGRPLPQWAAGDLARKRAVLLQDNRVSFGFTAAQVVEMGRAPWAGKASPAADRQAVVAAMAHTDTTLLADRPYPVLSGGERARVCLARILAQDTEVLLLDEPTAALDLRHQEEVMGIVRRSAKERGRCVVVVLHDLSLAAAYADRIAMISSGGLAAVGDPRSVLTAERLAEVYQLPVHLSDDHDGNLLVTPLRSG